MLRKYIKILLLYILYAIIGIVASIIGLYVQVLLCDVWRLPLWICR